MGSEEAKFGTMTLGDDSPSVGNISGGITTRSGVEGRGTMTLGDDSLSVGSEGAGLGTMTLGDDVEDPLGFSPELSSI